MTVRLARVSPREIDPELLWGSVLGVCGALGFTWLRLGLPLPGCIFRGLTGFPCLTCGGTRAARALAVGDLPTAFLINPLVALAAVGLIIYVLYALTAVLFRTRRIRLDLTHPAEANRIRWTLLTAALLNWIYVATL